MHKAQGAYAPKSGHAFMATHDIDGAQPGSRRSRKLSGAGNAIIDNRGMVAAGVKLGANNRPAEGLSNVFGLNANEYD